jgi:hypothetical protein
MEAGNAIDQEAIPLQMINAAEPASSYTGPGTQQNRPPRTGISNLEISSQELLFLFE